MNRDIKLFAIEGIPLIKEGDNLSKIIIKAIEENNLKIENGDILLIAQTIISKSDGLIRNLKEITPSDQAQDIYNKVTPKANSKGIPVKSPELIQAILDESRDIIKTEHVIIVETNHGYVCANAGIDKSNVQGEDIITLLPKNSDIEATKIRKHIKNATDKDVAVIITDSFGRPIRVGAVGVAIGTSGINPILDKRGDKDLFGHTLESTIVGQIDNLASAAQLVMGEADEGLPVVLIRGYNFDFDEKASINQILREKNSDIFRLNEDIRSFEEILKNRRSYKVEFDSKDVEKSIIGECIKLSRWAPSAHNNQQWRYIILDTKNSNREKLIQKMNEKLRDDLIKDEKSQKFIEAKIRKTKENFLTSPYLVLMCLDDTDLDKYPDTERTENEYILGVQSISASITYFLLSLEEKNLAACWYCAPLFAKDIVKNALNLPNSFIPMAFITVGYPKKTVKAPKRKELTEIIYNCSL